MRDCKLCGSKPDTDFHRYDCVKGMPKDDYIVALERKVERAVRVYEQYKHLDSLLTDRQWIGENLKDQVTFDLWQALRELGAKP